MNKIVKDGKYGKLTALELAYIDKNSKQYWRFQCECGNETIAESYNVLCRNTQSCGCKYKESELHRKYFKDGTNLFYLLEKNTGAKKNNKTGVNGVYFDKAKNKYAVQIMYKGVKYSLGRYFTIEEAAQARKEAEQEIMDGVFEINMELKKRKDCQ